MYFYIQRCASSHHRRHQSVTKIVTQRKTRRCTLSQSDWFIAQNERSDWLLRQEIATTRILNRAKRPQRSTFIHEIAASTFQFLQIFKQNCNHFASKDSHWHLGGCNHRRSHLERPKHWSLSKKRHCVTHYHEQRGVVSFLQQQISQSDCEISRNCGKNKCQQNTTNDLNSLRIPTGRRQASRLWTSTAEELNKTLPGSNLASG